MVLSRSTALVAAAVATSIALVKGSPLEYDPYTPVKIAVPLTSSHPAYGAKVNDSCTKPIIPRDPNAAIAASLKVELSVSRNLLEMEDSSSSDIKDLESYFGTSMEVNFNTLKSQYASGTAPTIPWAGSYWPMFQDSINYRWQSSEPSAAEKYAKAYGLDATTFMNKISAKTGVDSQKSSRSCASDNDCSGLNDGSACAKREGASTGRCIPTWYGICHAWSPAAILEAEPQCDVTKNNVTFHVFDIKALATYVYDGAAVKTVFTGARFNGPDSPATTDQYGRYTNAARRDLGPGYFHIAIANIMGKQNRSFVVDVTAGAEVWNQPVRSYSVQQMNIVNTRTASRKFFGTRTYPFNSNMVRLAYVKTTFSWIVESYKDGPLVSTGEIDAYTQSRDYEYLLELDANDNIIGGEWVGSSKTNHPDFLWFPTGKPATSAVTGTGLKYADVQELLKLSTSCSA